MSYSFQSTDSGSYRLKVLMVDNQGEDTYEIFYTYTEETASTSYSYPLPEAEFADVLGTTIGTQTSAGNQYVEVITSIKGTVKKERLATWNWSNSHDLKIAGDIFSPSIEYVPNISNGGGSRVRDVSNQITGDCIVHTYIYTNDGIVSRKLRITNIKTGKVLDLTDEDLNIEDMSPLDSEDPRWKLLTAIGVHTGG